MAFEVHGNLKKNVMPILKVYKFTWLNWHILISTLLKRISRLHYIYFRVVFHNVLLLKKKSCSVNIRTRKAQFSLHFFLGFTQNSA